MAVDQRLRDTRQTMDDPTDLPLGTSAGQPPHEPRRSDPAASRRAGPIAAILGVLVLLMLLLHAAPGVVRMPIGLGLCSSQLAGWRLG